MDVTESLYTSWGKAPVHLDARALRLYNRILEKLVKTGEILVYILTVSVLGVFLWFLFMGNFENVIFTDGTSVTCILQGKSGEIVNVNR
jgi:hypothetical protein